MAEPHQQITCPRTRVPCRAAENRRSTLPSREALLGLRCKLVALLVNVHEPSATGMTFLNSAVAAEQQPESTATKNMILTSASAVEHITGSTSSRELALPPDISYPATSFCVLARHTCIGEVQDFKGHTFSFLLALSAAPSLPNVSMVSRLEPPRFLPPAF